MALLSIGVAHPPHGPFLDIYLRWRPYRVECTGSLLTSEVKRHRARIVLGWGTAWETPRVLPAILLSFLGGNHLLNLGLVPLRLVLVLAAAMHHPA